jgi:hypothetical protein
VSFPSLAVRFALCAAVAAACSHAPAPATTPQAAAAPAAGLAPGQPDMVGDWAVQLLLQGQPTGTGMLRLSRSGDQYRGALQFESADRPYFVRSLQTDGTHVVMLLDTPDGDARVEGNLRAPTVFEGLYTSRTLNGRFTASRR